MAMPREDNSLVSTRQKDLMAVVVVDVSSFSVEAMASRREVRTALSCLGLLIVAVINDSASVHRLHNVVFESTQTIFGLTSHHFTQPQPHNHHHEMIAL